MDVELEYTMSKRFAVPLFIIAISNVVVNSFLIQALRKLKKLSTISFKYILLLSISDICLGITWVAYLCMLYTTFNGIKWIILTIANILMYFFATFSLSMVVVIALDRYIHMKFSVKYNTIVTKRRAVITVVSVVLILVFQVALLLSARILGFFFIVQLALNITGITCIIVVFMLYVKAYRFLRAQIERMNIDKSMPRPSTAPKRRNPSREVSRSIFWIFTSLLICYTPFCIFTAVSHYGHRNDEKLIVHLEYASFCLVNANSSFNAIILIALNRDLKRHLYNVLKIRSA